MSTPPQPQQFPIVSEDGELSYLTDDERRELELAQLQLAKMDVNIKARRLAIMQEHKANTDRAAAMTRDRRSDTANAQMPGKLADKTPDGKKSDEQLPRVQIRST